MNAAYPAAIQAIASATLPARKNCWTCGWLLVDGSSRICSEPSNSTDAWRWINKPARQMSHPTSDNCPGHKERT